MEKSEITPYFSSAIGETLKRMPQEQFDSIQEIRLRINRPVGLISGFGGAFLNPDGRFTHSAHNTITTTAADIRNCFEAVCQYSVHSFRREICEGFVTVRGGHRVGMCGTAVINGDKIENVKNISSLNFRVAHQIIGCADELYNHFFSGGLCSVLAAGAPMCGKTTLLRDLTRQLGSTYKTSVIDERGELAATWNGVPQNDIGVNTDVFDGYRKTDGIHTALRVMSPQVIVCDEIGSEEDFSAIRQASYSGVSVAATIHASDMDSLMKNIDISIFDKIAFLSEHAKIVKILKRTANGYV